jgi:D-alanine-D-alanine ligase
MGGIGSERQVSLESGRCVVGALTTAGYAAFGWDCTPGCLDILDSESVDVYFVALHGEFGEDGQLQVLLEEKGCIYTGSTSQTCKLAFDKMASKQHIEQVGVNTPLARAFFQTSDISTCVDQAVGWGGRWVVKPVRQGSSVGVHIVDHRDALADTCCTVLQDYGSGMIEQFIAGRELTVGFVDHQVLPVLEIRPYTPFYDFHAKYEDHRTEFLFDSVEPEVTSLVTETTLTCIKALGLRHFGRIDFILSEDGTLYTLEANAIPGLTSHSLLPKAAARAGMSMGTLCTRIVHAAYEEQPCKASLDVSSGT